MPVEAAVDIDAILRGLGLDNPYSEPPAPPAPPEIENYVCVEDGWGTVYGDGDGSLQQDDVGQNTQVNGGDVYCEGYTAYGDSYDMYDQSQGGHDTMYGGEGASWSNAWIRFYGDAGFMYDASQGGNDTIYGGDNANNTLYGDAYGLYDGSTGGNDTIVGGATWDAECNQKENYIYGDANELYNGAVGGADNLTGGQNGENYLYGESYYMYDSASGGNDTIVGGDTQGWCGQNVETYNEAYGDAVYMYDSVTGGNDTLTGGDVYANSSAGAYSEFFAAGDAQYMYNDAVAGNDTVTGSSADTGTDGYSGAFAFNVLAGDAMYMSDNAVAGDDVMFGGNAGHSSEFSEVSVDINVHGYGLSNTINVMAGDSFDAAWDTGDLPTFGNDTMTGGSSFGGGDGYGMVENLMVGDNATLDTDWIECALGGPEGFLFFESGFNDLLGLGDRSNTLAITEFVPTAGAAYGDDTMTGGDGYAFNALVGDAIHMYQGDTGGNDVLTAGDGYSFVDIAGGTYASLMVGDGVDASQATGGDDTLISGMGDDLMVGDFMSSWDSTGGADTFVFLADSGNDVVMDFDVSKDHLDLSALGDIVTNYVDMLLEGRIVETGFNVEVTAADCQPAGTWIYLGAEGDEQDSSVFLAGVHYADLIGPGVMLFGEAPAAAG